MSPCCVLKFDKKIDSLLTSKSSPKKSGTCVLPLLTSQQKCLNLKPAPQITLSFNNKTTAI